MSEPRPEITIRMAAPEDLAVVLHHRRSMFEAMGHRDAARLDAVMSASRDFFDAKLRDGSYVGFLAALPGGEVVAGGGIVFVDFQPQPRNPVARRGYVVYMWTERPHRRRGLARRLLSAMLDWSRARGQRAIYLHASDEGRPLYESFGFVASNEMRLEL
jgi:GNAT superfamily N-acetyltransferase